MNSISNKTEENGLRVELKRYLGGVPFSHVRTITREERRTLWKEVLPYAVLTSIFVILFLLFAMPVIESFTAFALLAGLLATVPGYCLYWAWPHLQTLWSGQVFVYIGPMQAVAAFDVVQAHYNRNYEMRPHHDRFIEILAIGKGDRIWRLEGMPNNGALRGVRPIQLALIPDHDERGLRPLTQEEKKELRVRASGFLQPRGFVMKNLVTLFFVLQVVRLAGQLIPGVIEGWFLPIIVCVVASTIVWAPYLKRLRFARLLRQDAKAGTVEDGSLRSGLPWVVRGEPARWRLGTARGGTNGVTFEEALEFERGYDDEERTRSWWRRRWRRMT